MHALVIATLVLVPQSLAQHAPQVSILQDLIHVILALYHAQSAQEVLPLAQHANQPTSSQESYVVLAMPTALHV
jgi:hypothetical protein